MMRTSGAEAEATTAADAAENRRLLLRGALGLLLLLGFVWCISALFEAELRWLGRQFVERFGLWGMAFGTWLADGFYFPIPPQFYMLMAVTGGVTPLVTFSVIAAGSLAGGVSGYCLAPYLARYERIEQVVKRTRPAVHRLSGEGWLRGVTIVSLTPFAFSWLCYAAGLYRIPKRAFGLICVLRLPKLLLYQWLVSLGWHGLGG